MRYERIGIVFPVYMFGVPLIVKRFCGKLKAAGSIPADLTLPQFEQAISKKEGELNQGRTALAENIPLEEAVEIKRRCAEINVMARIITHQ